MHLTSMSNDWGEKVCDKFEEPRALCVEGKVAINCALPNWSQWT